MMTNTAKIFQLTCPVCGRKDIYKSKKLTEGKRIIMACITCKWRFDAELKNGNYIASASYEI